MRTRIFTFQRQQKVIGDMRKPRTERQVTRSQCLGGMQWDPNTVSNNPKNVELVAVAAREVLRAGFGGKKACAEYRVVVKRRRS